MRMTRLDPSLLSFTKVKAKNERQQGTEKRCRCLQEFQCLTDRLVIDTSTFADDVQAEKEASRQGPYKCPNEGQGDRSSCRCFTRLDRLDAEPLELLGLVDVLRLDYCFWVYHFDGPLPK